MLEFAVIAICASILEEELADNHLDKDGTSSRPSPAIE
jgi:hypothetical protein